MFIDSGATKCDCILLDEAGKYVRHISDSGINASYTADAEIEGIFARLASDIGELDKVAAIQFAGAGCGNADNAARIEKALRRHFGKSKQISVESDLLGACNILCGTSSGLVAILGTGASCCLFNGKEIVQQIPSAGYMLGDEGSGTHLGMLFIQRFLREELSPEIVSIAGLHRSDVIRRIYREPHPNRFFSSFARFIGEHRTEPSIHSIIQEAFRLFFKIQISHINNYRSYPLNIVGAVGYYFQDDIRETADLFHVEIGRIEISPLSAIRQGQR